LIILTRKKQKKIVELLEVNQLILNQYNNLEGFDQITAFSKFTDNTAEAIFEIGGIKALNKARGFLFKNDNN